MCHLRPPSVVRYRCSGAQCVGPTTNPVPAVTKMGPDQPQNEPPDVISTLQRRPPSNVPSSVSPIPSVARKACPAPLSASVPGSLCLLGSGSRTQDSPALTVPNRWCWVSCAWLDCSSSKQSSSQAFGWPSAMLSTDAPPPSDPVHGTVRACQVMPWSVLIH